MKRLVAMVAFLAIWLGAIAQDSKSGYVLLNNGSVVYGTVTTGADGQKITVTTADGTEYVYRATEVNKVVTNNPAASLKEGKRTFNRYYEYDRGFWFGFDLYGGISTNVGSKRSNSPVTELDATVGYRFNEYVKVGVGAGVRYYINGENIRYRDADIVFPIYANVRGNIIPSYERKVVPYYSLSVGGVVDDGVMVRPTIGARFGDFKRSSFLLGLSYLGQSMKDPWNENRFQSFVVLSVGYEF